MTSACRICCDHPECKSTVKLSAPEDLRNVAWALGVRGWVVAEGGPGKKDGHYCPNHHPAPPEKKP